MCFFCVREVIKLPLFTTNWLGSAYKKTEQEHVAIKAFIHNFRWAIFSFFLSFFLCPLCISKLVKVITWTRKVSTSCIFHPHGINIRHTPSWFSEKKKKSKSNCLETCQINSKRLRGYCIIWSLSANASNKFFI